MARYEHLQLVRLPQRLERRKTGGGSGPPTRDPAHHSARLRRELDTAVQYHRRLRRPEFVDPSLILRVQMTGPLLEEDWNRLGLAVLSSDENKTLILFSSTEEMVDFRRRLTQYGLGAPAGQKYPPYATFVGGIESIGSVEPRDRIGERARGDGLIEADDFLTGVIYTVDIELWDLGRRELRQRKLDEVSAYVTAQGGDELDRYVGPSISLIRVRCDGAIINTLLSLEDIAEIDLLPSPDVTTGGIVNISISDLPTLETVGENTPIIGIIDSGVNNHPLIEDILVGAIAVPENLGTSDEFGHGTRVAGVAVFGDLRGQLSAGTLQRGAKLCSAKVLDHTGNFPERKLAVSQIREAITRLNHEFGCRIFVAAIGDKKKIYDGGKVGPWAATLDELAAELDVLIIVAAGNRAPRVHSRIEQAITGYPHYLMEPTNRLCEPAGAMNVITVGSLAHGEGLASNVAENVGVRPITQALEPSPFTRVGPGLGGAIKPDLVDLGGTLIFDPFVQRLRGGEDVPEAGVLSLHNRPVDSLFTGGSGTSYSAPLVAFKASQILALFPDASANLIRALLATGARVPPQAAERLQPLGPTAQQAICGHGLVDLERAAFSDDARVALYAQDELSYDHFAVYQIPILESYQTEPGRRTIRVTLAYDPPVRHTRRDYAGVAMSFRLIRGCDPDYIFEHFRKRTIAEEGNFPELEARYNCKLSPGSKAREKSSLQTASVSFFRDIAKYGDTYYLVVRCASGWAGEVGHQSFSVVVEISHEAQVQLYERLRQRVRA